ncbi:MULTISPECIES: SDR family oxidoreductase [unclassified Nocardioides]|uniref:SDR family oxidoreductase n=1 Tax=unclassified Nocardioides TaxID=2615069 RepID=UPI001152AAAF|nr:MULTISPECIES: SDR family oxidoreductase [unclassified Nocardioides]TQK71156.1 NAD(P)-dependent dehydrogenase (short-subunit alcohol dehydrogenase family) [Nocardioides sp. SLBN-35]WGY04675.1 SDR family oxidoreductase [Nocardioides sp. QY071]
MTDPVTGVLAGKAVLVAGVGPGLGQALAVRSAIAGADVVLASRNAERLGAVAQEVRATGRRAVVVPTDLADPVAVGHLVDTTLAELGRLDAVLHNAYLPPSRENLLDSGLDRVRDELASPLMALEMVRRAAPALVASRGSVVVVNSMIVRNRLPRFGAYRMTKASLLALARGLSIELGPQGVRVNSIAPGYIMGDAVEASFAKAARARGVTPEVIHDEIAADTDLRRLPRPEEIADAAVFLASDLARAITGQCLDVTSGATHH